METGKKHELSRIMMMSFKWIFIFWMVIGMCVGNDWSISQSVAMCIEKAIEWVDPDYSDE